jgi:Ner family transcriptional regulator
MSEDTRHDWHWEDIKAALRKRGWSFNRIGRKCGYNRADTPRVVLAKPWPVMERTIADIIGVQPSEIWPSRYRADGTPKGRGIRGEYSKFRFSGNGKDGAAA